MLNFKFITYFISVFYILIFSLFQKKIYIYSAEWDILYAVTEAATDNATVIPEPTETITTNIATITTTAATSQTDGQPAQLRSASPETKNR